MFLLAAQLVIVATWCRQGAGAEVRWRETLLGEARERVQTWYTDPNLLDAPQMRSGVKVSMMKQDMKCGGDLVPVTFAEFDVKGARPVDVFNTMLDTSAQKEWNQQCQSATLLGEWHNEGARAWAVVFNIPLVANREFLQWQVADANFTSEEFWLVFSTQKNEELHKKSPVQQGGVDSQNCLGAYHITKILGGARVIITQQVDVHPFLPFPMHLILTYFPPAWQGTINFVTEMSGRAAQLASSGSSLTATDAPAFMLQEASAPSGLQADPVLKIVGQNSVFPKLDATAPMGEARLGPLHCAVLVLLLPLSFICAVSLRFGSGRCASRRTEATENLVGSDPEIDAFLE